MVEVLSRYRANPEAARDFYFNEQRLGSAPAGKLRFRSTQAQGKKTTFPNKQIRNERLLKF